MLSTRFASKLERAASFFLTHKFTLTSKQALTGNPVDDDGQPIYEDVVLGTAIRGLFVWQDVSITTPQGTSIEHTPLLYVLRSQAINEGDIVSSILSRNGTVLLQSARIQTINLTAEGADPTIKLCTLSGAQV